MVMMMKVQRPFCPLTTLENLQPNSKKTNSEKAEKEIEGNSHNK